MEGARKNGFCEAATEVAEQVDVLLKTHSAREIRLALRAYIAEITLFRQNDQTEPPSLVRIFASVENTRVEQTQKRPQEGIGK